MVYLDIFHRVSRQSFCSFLERKAQAVLDANKSKLFEFHRQNSYDNYVTGGNSKMKMDDLLSQLELEYIYEEVEADINFV